MVWLVKARCLPPQYHPTAKGAEERYRFNIQEVTTVTPLSGTMREEAIAYMDHGIDQSFCSESREFAPRFPFQDGFAPCAQEAHELAEYLHEIGELQENETLTSALRRLLERRITVDNRVPISRIAFAEAGE